MHHEVAQECPEAFEVFPVDLVHRAVVRRIVLAGAWGGHFAVHGVEAPGDADDHRRHGQGVQKGGQEGGDEGEQERQRDLVAHLDEELGEDEEQQILHEIDAGHHEDQQQDHLEAALHFVEDGVGVGQPQEQRLDGEQAPRLQRIALERHRQGEDELQHQHPAGDVGAEHEERDGVQDQKANDRQLVPLWGVAEKVCPVRIRGQLAPRGIRHSMLPLMAGLGWRWNRRPVVRGRGSVESAAQYSNGIERMLWPINPSKFISEVEPPSGLEGEEAYYFVFLGADELLSITEHGIPRPVTADEFRWLDVKVDFRHYLGRWENRACYVLAASGAVPEGYAVSGLRGWLGRVDPDFFYLAGRAKQIAEWNRDHRHCGRCGGLNDDHGEDRAKHCPECDLTTYPRLSPSIIVLVRDGERMLLARNARWPHRHVLDAGGIR